MYVNLVDSNGNLITPANPISTSIVGSLANIPVVPTGDKTAQKSTVIVLFNSLAIADILYHWYGGGASGIAIPDWNKYNHHSVYIRNTHDQAIDVSFAINTTGSTFNSVAATTKSIAAGGTYVPVILTDADIRILKGIISRDVSVYVKAAVAPTTGAITVELQMWAE
jgi:hypothetical protein